MSKAKEFLSSLFDGKVFDLHIEIHEEGLLCTNTASEVYAVNGQILVTGTFSKLGALKLFNSAPSSIVLNTAKTYSDRNCGVNFLRTDCSFSAYHGKETYKLLKLLLNDLYPGQENDNNSV